MPKAEAQAEVKPVRLYKAVRELNVSAETIVQALKESGFDLDKKLAAGDVNAKLPPEMYAALQDVYQEDMDTRTRVGRLRSRREAEEEAVREAAETAEAPAAEPSGDGAPEPEPPVVEAEPVPEEPETPVEAPPVDEEIEAEPAAPVADMPEEMLDEEKIVEQAEEEDEPLAAEILESDEVAEVAEAEEVQDDEEQAEPVADIETLEPEERRAEAADEVEIEQEEVEEEVEEQPEDVEELEAVAEEEADDEAEEDPEASDEEPPGIVRADRYTLQGTTVLGKINLTDIDAGKRRKRKRKKSAAPEPPAQRSAGAPKTKRTKKKPKVDKSEVTATLQETLQRLQQGASRDRQRRRRERRTERDAVREQELLEAIDEGQFLQVMEFVSTGELADLMGVPVTDVIQKGLALGMMVSINQRLDADAITLLADEFNFEVEFLTDVGLDDIDIIEDDPEDSEPRPPVITIMGHVDHGKTSLLDHIREANVVAGEAGGITQHIGAYSVEVDDDRRLTFLDTPGHEAFTAMRARGAQVTDIVILVVAADDQVMPQTKEAINHAKAAGVPIVVAINKMDRPEANSDRIMQQLGDENVLVEQYGGKVQAEFVSAKTGDGVKDLLDKVLLESELLELTANPDREAVGTVIESQLEQGRGIVATVLVETGTLRVGDIFVAGTLSGRVRAMFDERDQQVSEAGPSRPVRVLGFPGAPEAGDRLVVMEGEREARDVAAKRQQILREQTMRTKKHVSLDDISRRMALGELATLNLILKADVGGSVEALADSLLKIGTDEVAVDIIHSGVGAINESDVMLAAASDAIIFGFQVRPMAGVRQFAEREEIDIRLYSVIYDAIEDIRDALEGMLVPEEKEKTLGMIEVRETWRVPRAGTVAGSYVLSGRVRRNDRVRLIRDGVVVYEGVLGSLRRFKDDVREVQSGYECGLSIQNFNDIKIGDQIEVFEIVEERRTLTA